MTTPTIAQRDATNMPGVYSLLIDESGMTTLDSGKDTMELTLHIDDSGGVMHPVTLTHEIYRPETTEGNTLDVTSTGAGGIDWGNIENKTTANDLSGTDIQLCDTITTYTGNTKQTGDNYARLGAPAGASVSADIAAIEAQTDDIGAAGAGLTAVPWNASWDAEVQSEVQDALVANGLDHLVQASVTGADIANNSIFARLVSSSATADWDSFANTTDSLQAIRDNVATASALTTAQNDLDTITGADGVTLATAQALYAPAKAGDAMTLSAGAVTAAVVATNAIDADALAADAVTEIQSGLATSAAQTTAQNDLDILTGTDGATLATAQALYAPAKAGDAMAITGGQTVATVTTVTNQVTADVTAISGDSTAADKLEASLDTIVTGAVSGGTSDADTVVTNITGHGDDTFIGRTLIFLDGTLQYEAGAITDYVSASGTFEFAASTFTTGAGDGNLVVIV
jgi:hypothetical protein